MFKTMSVVPSKKVNSIRTFETWETRKIIAYSYDSRQPPIRVMSDFIKSSYIFYKLLTFLDLEKIESKNISHFWYHRFYKISSRILHNTWRLFCKMSLHNTWQLFVKWFYKIRIAECAKKDIPTVIIRTYAYVSSNSSVAVIISRRQPWYRYCYRYRFWYCFWYCYC